MASPAHKIRYGNLKVAIWRNTNEKGTFYSVNTTRSYKAGDDTWKDSDSLMAEDCLIMGELLRQAFHWIARQKEADYTARKAREEAERLTA